jgi:hypothetical protein
MDKLDVIFLREREVRGIRDYSKGIFMQDGKLKEKLKELQKLVRGRNSTKWSRIPKEALDLKMGNLSKYTFFV